MWSLSCQSSGHFLDYLHWCECYLVVSLEWGRLKIFLLCHLPWKFGFCFGLLFLLNYKPMTQITSSSDFIFVNSNHNPIKIPSFFLCLTCPIPFIYYFYICDIIFIVWYYCLTVLSLLNEVVSWYKRETYLPTTIYLTVLRALYKRCTLYKFVDFVCFSYFWLWVVSWKTIHRELTGETWFPFS